MDIFGYFFQKGSIFNGLISKKRTYQRIIFLRLLYPLLNKRKSNQMLLTRSGKDALTLMYMLTIYILVYMLIYTLYHGHKK